MIGPEHSLFPIAPLRDESVYVINFGPVAGSFMGRDPVNRGKKFGAVGSFETAQKAEGPFDARHRFGMSDEKGAYGPYWFLA